MNTGRALLINSAKRIPEYLICLLVVITINFILPRALPGDAFAYLEDEQSDAQVVVSKEWRKKLSSYYGLDKPIHEQYILYLKNTVSLNFGFSTYFKGPVSKLIAQTLPWTILLTGTSLLLSAILGIVIGAFSAWAGGWTDKCLQTSVITIIGIPSFVLAVIFQLVFSVHLKLFPMQGATSVFVGDVSFFAWAVDVFSHSVLPVSVLTLGLTGSNYFITRTCMRDIANEDYIIFARTKGLGEGRIVFKHMLRNAMLPVVTHIALRVGYAITGTVFIETIFSYPGMGKLIFDAVSVHDYPVLQGTLFVFTLFVLGANLIADFIYPFIDPRLRE